MDLIKWNLITEEGEGERSYKNLTRFFHGRFTSPILSVLIGWTNIRGGCVDPDYLVQWCFHGERGASKIKRTGADYFKNKFSRSRILLSKSGGGEGREKENETHKKCIILRKNGQEKVISKRNCLPSKILWYFFFLQFNEMKILLSKSREKKQKWNALFKKKTKNFKLDSKRNYTKILRFFFLQFTGVRIGNETDSRTRNKWPFHQINHPKEISLQREREERETRFTIDLPPPRPKKENSKKRRTSNRPFPRSTMSRRCFERKNDPRQSSSSFRPKFEANFSKRAHFRASRKVVERGKRVEETFRGDERKPQSDIFPLGTAACPRLDCLEGICYGHLLPTKRREGTRVPRGPLFATTKHI